MEENLQSYIGTPPQYAPQAAPTASAVSRNDHTRVPPISWENEGYWAGRFAEKNIERDQAKRFIAYWSKNGPARDPEKVFEGWVRRTDPCHFIRETTPTNPTVQQALDVQIGVSAAKAVPPETVANIAAYFRTPASERVTLPDYQNREIYAALTVHHFPCCFDEPTIIAGSHAYKALCNRAAENSAFFAMLQRYNNVVVQRFK